MAEPVPQPAGEAYAPGSMPEVFQLVDAVAHKLRQMQRESVREAGLTPPQYAVMNELWALDGRTFKELAAAARCSPATMTGIVDTLEGKGLVHRAPNPDDRRSLLVVLTAAGRSLQAETPKLDRIFDGCCDALRPEEAEQLSHLLRKLEQAL